MNRRLHKSVTALAMTAMVASSISVATISLTAAPAFSQNQNSNGNSNSGRGNSNRGGGGGGADRDGKTASLGALNAAHANAVALANASENSRVGMIAVYKTLVGITADAKTALDKFITECVDGPNIDEANCTQILINAASDANVVSFTKASYIDFLKEKISAAETLEGEALVAAANKSTDDEIIQALWDLLEIDGYELPDPTD